MWWWAHLISVLRRQNPADLSEFKAIQSYIATKPHLLKRFTWLIRLDLFVPTILRELLASVMNVKCNFRCTEGSTVLYPRDLQICRAQWCSRACPCCSLCIQKPRPPRPHQHHSLLSAALDRTREGNSFLDAQRISHLSFKHSYCFTFYFAA